MLLLRLLTHGKRRRGRPRKTWSRGEERTTGVERNDGRMLRVTEIEFPIILRSSKTFFVSVTFLQPITKQKQCAL